MGRRPLPKRISPFLTRPLTLVSLWGISSPFELLSPSSGQVTNALLTRSPLGFHKSEDPIFLVRLACIRHAASVHPEPGSNSPYNLSFPCGNVHYGSLLLTCFTSYHSSIVKVPLSPLCQLPNKKPRCRCPFPGFSHRRSLSDQQIFQAQLLWFHPFWLGQTCSVTQEAIIPVFSLFVNP